MPIFVEGSIVPIGSGSGTPESYTTWDLINAAALAADDGWQGILSQTSEILRLVKVGSTIRFVGNVIDFGGVDNASPAFTQGSVGSGANIIRAKPTASTFTWLNGAVYSHGALLLAFLGAFNDLGVLHASCETALSVTTTAADQIACGVGFVRDPTTEGLISCLSRNAGDPWTASLAIVDGVSVGNAWTLGVEIASRGRDDAETAAGVVSHTQHYSRSSDPTTPRMAWMGNYFCGDSTDSAQHDGWGIDDISAPGSNSDNTLVLMCDQLGGDIATTFSVLRWLETARPGGLTP